jgi:branched-chain amino acid aminotransferase
MNGVVNVNGRIANADEAVVPVYDHGFLYGEGVYETLRTYAREPFLFGRHMDRLRRSARMISLPVPLSDAELLARVTETTAACPGLTSGTEAYIRILLTRGVGDLSYNLDATPAPTLVIIVKPLVPFPERLFTEGIRVALVGTRRNHPDALNPLIKSNNLLNNAMAMQEAYRHGAEEALMQNQAGAIVECSQSNFFIVRKGLVETPPLDAGLLPGITRAFVIELAQAGGLQVAEATLTPADALGADEAFITGTTREITPVVRIGDKQIGAGVPGPVTKQLLASFRSQTPRTR